MTWRWNVRVSTQARLVGLESYEFTPAGETGAVKGQAGLFVQEDSADGLRLGVPREINAVVGKMYRLDLELRSEDRRAVRVRLRDMVAVGESPVAKAAG